MQIKFKFILKYTLIILCYLFVFNINIPILHANTQENKTYRFGVITLSHPIVLYRQYIPFFDYINEHLPWSFELTLFKEYNDVLKAIQNGTLDMALLGGNTFIQAQQHTKLEPIAAVLSRNQTSKTFSVFMTKSDNYTIKNFQDFHNKSIAFGSIQSTSSYIIPLLFLSKQGITLQDFSNYTNLNNHDAVARAVLRGEYDIGVMGESFAKRFLDQGLKKIAVTNSFPGFILVARTGVPPEVAKALQDFLLSIKPKSPTVLEKSKHWPEILRYGFAPVNMDDYDLFKNLPQVTQ